MRHGKHVKENSKISLHSDVEIDRCHRIGPRKTKTGQDWDGPCTIDAGKLKNTGISLYKDFSKDTMELGHSES